MIVCENQKKKKRKGKKRKRQRKRERGERKPAAENTPKRTEKKLPKKA